MVKRCLGFLFILLSMISTVFATTVTFESDYGIKNIILFVVLLTLFLLSYFIYKKTDDIEFSKDNLLRSVTSYGVKFLCWVWFMGIIYMSQAILLISSSDTYLLDKLDLMFSLVFITSIVGGIVLILNGAKMFNKFTGMGKGFKDLVFEIKNGGKK